MSDEPSTSNTTRAVAAAGGRHGPAAPKTAAQEKRERNRRMFNRKREAFLADLMLNLDVLVYAQLTAIYYMDCSFLRFLMRAFVQIGFFPRSATYPPGHRPLGLIVGTNILCLILHAYLSRPAAGEATRGYLHGGLAMDFIGEKGPTSKLHLVLLDLLVLALQLLNLGLLLTRKKAKEGSEPAKAGTETATAPEQNHDFEERGQLRSDHRPVDIELQDLNPSGTTSEPRPNDDAGEERESEALLASTNRPSSDSHIFDAFNSGEIVIADLNLPTVIRTQILEYRDGRTESTATIATSFNAQLAGAGLGFRFPVGNRAWGV